jgi:hypothetical protein
VAAIVALATLTAGVTAACGGEPASTTAPSSSTSTTTAPTSAAPSTRPGTTTGTSPTTAPPDATTTTAAGPPTTRTGDNGMGEGEGNAIRKVDFANFTFPADACGTTFAQPPSGGFALTNGEAANGTPRDEGFYSVTLHVDIAYGDLTGDGNDEAAILLDCNAGTRPVVFGWIYTLGTSGPSALAAITFGGTVQAITTSAAQLLDVRIEQGRVMARWAVYVAGDPACCPSGQTTSALRWNGTSLVSDDPPR